VLTERRRNLHTAMSVAAAVADPSFRASGNGTGAATSMDFVFVMIILAVYAATHWLVWALARLGGGK
jgi:hypothetical protein